MSRVESRFKELETPLVEVSLDLEAVLALEAAAKGRVVERLAHLAEDGKPRDAETGISRRAVMMAVLELERTQWSWPSPEMPDSRLKIVLAELGHLGVVPAMFPVTVSLPVASQVVVLEGVT
jgi:hypothetical protein